MDRDGELVTEEVVGASDEEARASDKWFLFAGVLASLLATGLVLMMALPMGFPQWTPVAYRKTLGVVDPVALVVGPVLVAALVAAPQLRRLGIGWRLAAICCLAIAWNAVMHRPVDRSWTGRVLYFTSGEINPFFRAGVRAESVAGYPEQHRRVVDAGYVAATVAERRLTTYPPGLPMVVRAARGLVSASGLAGPLAGWGRAQVRPDEQWLPIPQDDLALATAVFLLLLQFAVLGVVPILGYWLARELGAGEQQRLWAAAAIWLVPSVGIYACTPNALMVPWALATVAATLAGMRARKVWLMGIGSVLLFVGAALSYAAAPIFLVCFCLVMGWGEKRQRLGFAACWAVVGICWWGGFTALGFEPLGGFLGSMANNREFYGMENRGYTAALGWNLLQFGVFLGPLWLLAVWRGLQELAAGCGGGGWRKLAVLDRLQVVMLACLGLVYLSGGARGEVDRNWLVFMGPLVVVAACRLRGDGDWKWPALVAGAHCLALACMLEAIFAFV